MVYIMALIYSLCIFIYFFNFKSKLYYKILCVIVTLPVIFIDLIDMIRPGMYMDLVRIYEEMKSLNLYGWYGLNEEIYSEAILSKVYLYLIALTGINQLLPIVNTFFVYFLALYMINKMGEKLNIDNKWKNRSILFITLFIYYLNVTTNIRYTLAITICFVVCIYDLILRKNKFICIIGYIFSILLHPGVIIVLFFRVCANFSLKYFFLLSIFLGIAINSYLENILQIALSNDIGILTSIAFKVSGYAYGESTFEGFTTIYRVSVMSFDIVVLLQSWLIRKYLKEEYRIFYKKIIDFNIILSVMAFIFMAMNIVYANRIEAIMIYFIGVYIYIIGNSKNFKLSLIGYNNFKIISYLLFFIMTIYFWYFNIYSQYNYYI